jgi:hypothetical protein
MFPVFFDPRVLRNREKTGPGDQTLAKSYDIGKLTPEASVKYTLRHEAERAPPARFRVCATEGRMEGEFTLISVHGRESLAIQKR